MLHLQAIAPQQTATESSDQSSDENSENDLSELKVNETNYVTLHNIGNMTQIFFYFSIKKKKTNKK